MNEESNTQTYLSISSNKLEIYLFDVIKFENLYSNEIKSENNSLDYTSLDNFLNENILKIEKLIGKFVKNIFIIIENEQLFRTHIGIKKKNYNKVLNYDAVKSLVVESKELFQKSYKDQKIMHIIVNNYLINGKNFEYLKKEIQAEDLSLIINFISIPENLSYPLENLLEKYQIKINKYLDKEYVSSFFEDQKIKFPVMVYKILNGSNSNEVQLIPKISKNRGIFEKFFQLFS